MDPEKHFVPGAGAIRAMGGANLAERRAEMPTAINRADEYGDELLKIVELLEARLEPVLSPKAPSKEPSENPMPSSTFARDVTRLGEKMKHASTQLGSILDRLEV